MSSCMFPLLDFVGEEDEEQITEEVMKEIKEDLDFEVKRAIDEVVLRLQKGVQ